MTPLSPAGLVVRAVVTLAALGLLAYGQWADTNQTFPLGTLSQYATARDMDGTVRSLYLQADTDQQARLAVPLDQPVVGVGRAEVEGQLARIVADPSLLQDLADAYADLQPDAPPLRTLHLMRSEQRLHDGLVTGQPVVEELATWSVPPVGRP